MSPQGRRVNSGSLVETGFQGCFDLLPSPGLGTSKLGLQGKPAFTAVSSSCLPAKGVCLQGPAIQPSLCPAAVPLPFSPTEFCFSFPSPPKTELSWRLKMSKCEARLHTGLC